MFSGLAEIVKRESFIALYKGNGAQMVRVFPYAAIQFTSFEFYKTVINLFLFNTIGTLLNHFNLILIKYFYF